VTRQRLFPAHSLTGPLSLFLLDTIQVLSEALCALGKCDMRAEFFGPFV